MAVVLRCFKKEGIDPGPNTMEVIFHHTGHQTWCGRPSRHHRSPSSSEIYLCIITPCVNLRSLPSANPPAFYWSMLRLAPTVPLNKMTPNSPRCHSSLLAKCHSIALHSFLVW